MRHLILLLLCVLMSCNIETVVNEHTPMKQSMQDKTHRVNIVVDNQAKGVIFESDSIVLHYQDMGLCKTFETDASYISDIVLNGNIRTEYYSIYSGDMWIPIRQGIRDSINNIQVMLYDGCPWYSADGNEILQSIQFGNPDVDDWEEDGAIRIGKD